MTTIDPAAARVLSGAEPWCVLEGDALALLPKLCPESVAVILTSPPYWGGLRDYGAADVGTLRDPSAYAGHLLEVGKQLRRVLSPEGCLWLNLGESFAASGKGGGGAAGKRGSWDTVKDRKGFRMPPAGYKMKDQTLAPFLVADAFRRDGWYLRSTVVWSKPAATEPHRLDRPAQSHEYVFLLAKSEQYGARTPGEDWWGRSVWEITPDSCKSHPATMPLELARRCLACSPTGVVLDPFCGHGTSGVAARNAGRSFLGMELRPEYAEAARKRIAATCPLFDACVRTAARERTLYDQPEDS